MKRLRIAVIHPQPKVGGGSENKALWIMETLKDYADVFFVAMGKIDLEGLNKAYRTSLTWHDITPIEILIPPFLNRRFDALRSYRLGRYIRKHATDFDVLISSYNVMDFGITGIQFISDFSFDDRLRRSLLKKPKGIKSWIYFKSPIRSAYLKLGRILAGGNQDGWKKNWTIANSDWGGKMFEKVYGIRTQTIYPPVFNDFPDIPWGKRENGFVTIGRIVPEKQIEKIIDILKRVRQHRQDIHLHVIGKGGDISYQKKIENLAFENRDWIILEGAVFGSQKSNILACHRYGLHACENEFVGNAVIEMVKAGCLVWVPEKGGPAEIVGHHQLVYKDELDAVKKIEEVLGQDILVRNLRSHIKSQAEKFSIKAFQSQILELIDQFVNRNEK